MKPKSSKTKTRMKAGRTASLRSGRLFGEEKRTGRNFPLVKFTDEYGAPCSIQESSRCVCENEDGSVDDPLGWLWLGIDDPAPQIMKSNAHSLGMKLPPGEVSGWMPYPLPEGVLVTTRMHLNEKQVRGLIARLRLWLKTGTILASPNGAAQTRAEDQP